MLIAEQAIPCRPGRICDAAICNAAGNATDSPAASSKRSRTRPVSPSTNPVATVVAPHSANPPAISHGTRVRPHSQPTTGCSDPYIQKKAEIARPKAVALRLRSRFSSGPAMPICRDRHN
jgi:hypothetical protein